MKTSKRIKVLGVAGTVQTGKSELRPVFEECGWIFHDLNDPQCDLRAKGTERYEMFMSRFPGSLKECGSKTGQFYDLVTPEFYHSRIREDIELLVPIVLDLCKKAGDAPIALSWEYLPFLAKRIPLDHTLLLESNPEIWVKRLRSRLKNRGVEGEVSNDRIWKAIQLLDVWPERIHALVEQEMEGRFSIFDVSPENWNADELMVWLHEAR